MRQYIGWTIYRLTRPLHRPFVHRTRRARVVVTNGNNVLLVKTFLGSPKWKLPGGGIRSNEDEAIGAAREVKEELGIRLDPDKLEYLLDMRITSRDRYYTAVCFGAEVRDRTFKRNRRELTAAKWFPINELPDDHHTVVDKALAAWQRIR